MTRDRGSGQRETWQKELGTRKAGSVDAINFPHRAHSESAEASVEIESFARGDRHKAPANWEWPEYKAARLFSGDIRNDYGAKSCEVGFLECGSGVSCGGPYIPRNPVIRPRKPEGPKLASKFLNGEEPRGTMPNKVATISVLVLFPLIAFATPKGRETIKLQVVSSKTKIHSSSSGNAFIYTDFMFTLVDGKTVVYICDQRGDICPLMEDGKTYTADRAGDVIYISMSVPGEKKPVSVKYKQAGSW